jgi:hypothetical protein
VQGLDLLASRHGNFFASCGFVSVIVRITEREVPMNGLIYLIGLIVVIMAVLSLLGLR